MPIMARLGVGLLVIPQKPWAMVREDFDVYHRVWAEENPGTAPPAPMCGGFVVVDNDAGRAEEMAHRYIGGYYGSVLRHYEFEDNAPRRRAGLRVLHAHHALSSSGTAKVGPSTTLSA